MNKEAFAVQQVAPDTLPKIVKVDYSDPAGMSWRDAKKALRAFFTNEARKLRSVNVTSYFNG